MAGRHAQARHRGSRPGARRRLGDGGLPGGLSGGRARHAGHLLSPRRPRRQPLRAAHPERRGLRRPRNPPGDHRGSRRGPGADRTGRVRGGPCREPAAGSASARDHAAGRSELRGRGPLHPLAEVATARLAPPPRGARPARYPLRRRRQRAPHSPPGRALGHDRPLRRARGDAQLEERAGRRRGRPRTAVELADARLRLPRGDPLLPCRQAPPQRENGARAERDLPARRGLRRPLEAHRLLHRRQAAARRCGARAAWS